MSGGKGGSSTQTVEIPEYIEEAAQRNLNKAERISQIGYVPYYGPDVAAFTPMQQAGFQNTADVAGAFGMATPVSQRDIMGGMGAPTQYANGVMGYSSQPLYQQSLDQFAAARPSQKAYIDSFFIDPSSGQYAYQPFDYTQTETLASAARRVAAEEAAEREAVRAAEEEAFRLANMGPAPGDPGMSGNPQFDPDMPGGYNTEGSFDLGGILNAMPAARAVDVLKGKSFIPKDTPKSKVRTNSNIPTELGRDFIGMANPGFSPGVGSGGFAGSVGGSYGSDPSAADSGEGTYGGDFGGPGSFGGEGGGWAN